MLSLFKIWTVAVYEIKTLFRSWFFRIFSVLAILILVLLNIVLFVEQGSGEWTLRGIPASIPYMNLLLLNVAQAFIGIFMASDFFKFDKTLHMTDAIYTRSMTNADYVFGKTLGVLVLFFSLNILILLLAFVINLFFTDVPVVPLSYILYPLIISIPTLVYIFGLSFLCMVVLKNQAITFIVLLGYIASTLFILGNKFHYLFDYMAFNVPLMYSDFVGFGETTSIFIHRGIYLSLGLGFIFMTILFIKRLPQSRIMNKVSLVLSILLIINGLNFGRIYLARIENGLDLRSEMNVLNNSYIEMPKVSVTDLHLDLLHNGNSIEVKADITFTNNTSSSIDSYIFSLNPSLEVLKVDRNGTNLPFDRDLHILTIEPGLNLMPRETDNISVVYHGGINEEASYTDIPEDLREEKYRLFVYNIDKRYGFITPEYVLLTHENLWYPTAGVPFGSAFPKTQSKDMINFELTVKTDTKLVALSQGNSTSNPENGEYWFKPEVPMPQLSLVIGKYEEKSIVVDNMTYSIFVLNGHDFFSKYFNEIGKKLHKIIEESKQDYERKIKLEYPYKRFSFIEVPIQFFTYDRLWTLSHETIQPEQVFLPEKAVLFNAADFRRIMYYQNRYGKSLGGLRTPEEFQTDLFRKFMSETIFGEFPLRRISRMKRKNMDRGTLNAENLFSSLLSSSLPSYEIFPNFYNFTNYFHSEKWPVFNISLENYLKSGIGNTNYFSSFMGLSNVESANIELSKQTLTEIIADPDKKDIVYDVVNNKADYLFAFIKANIGEREFEAFLQDILTESRFAQMEVKDFLNRLKERFGFDLELLFDTWINERIIPAFLFTDINCIEILDDNRIRYNVTFKAQNNEPVDGLFSAGFNEIDGGSVDKNTKTELLEYHYIIAGNQAKEIGIILDNAPRSIQFNTFISKNLPATFDRALPLTEFDEDAEIFEGEKIIAQLPVPTDSGEIIVDNEDPGFKVFSRESDSLLKRMINNKNASIEEEYIGFSFWNPPNSWRATVHNEFYGIFKCSAYYIKSGAGDQKVSWQAEITQNGKYDIFYSTPPFKQLKDNRFRVAGEKGNRDGSVLADYNFIIYHDAGVDETVLNVGKTIEDWTYLGTYYLSKGIVKIELTNKTKGRFVYADAVKWSLNQ
ncbi:hypothetical protein ACFL1R_04355 [Candidatus Latescibacterota bacterium]